MHYHENKPLMRSISKRTCALLCVLASMLTALLSACTTPTEFNAPKIFGPVVGSYYVYDVADGVTHQFDTVTITSNSHGLGPREGTASRATYSHVAGFRLVGSQFTDLNFGFDSTLWINQYLEVGYAGWVENPWQRLPLSIRDSSTTQIVLTGTTTSSSEYKRFDTITCTFAGNDTLVCMGDSVVCSKIVITDGCFTTKWDVFDPRVNTHSTNQTAYWYSPKIGFWARIVSWEGDSSSTATVNTWNLTSYRRK